MQSRFEKHQLSALESKLIGEVRYILENKAKTDELIELLILVRRHYY